MRRYIINVAIHFLSVMKSYTCDVFLRGPVITLHNKTKCNNNLDEFILQYAIAIVRNERHCWHCNKRIGGIIPRLSSKRVYFTRYSLSRIRTGFRNPGSGFLRRFQFIWALVKSPLLDECVIAFEYMFVRRVSGQKTFNRVIKAYNWLVKFVSLMKTRVSREDPLRKHMFATPNLACCWFVTLVPGRS